MNTRLHEISIMRVILILLIVLGHVFAVYGTSQSWPLPYGWDANRLYSWVNPIVISFALQTFVFISGYLFAYQHHNKKITFLSTLKSKLHRLYLPTIFWGILYSYLILNTSPFSFNGFADILTGVGHLWFLPMLFWCFLFMQLFLNTISKVNIANFVFLTVLSGLSLFLPSIFRASEFCFYFIYFVLGYWIYGFKKECYQKKINLLLLWAIVLILCLFKCLLLSDVLEQRYPVLYMWAVRFILGIAGSLALYFTALRYQEKMASFTRVLDWQGWFGIYIVHQFILKFLYYKTEYCSIVQSPWITFFIVFLLSVLIVVLLRKIKIFRGLL